jgi:glyoxylase-like metal-dependent hydrolase (beta-lactamase superfamily II)/ferredoxin
MQRLSAVNFFLLLNLGPINAFFHTSSLIIIPKRTSGLFVKPSRLPDNVDGVLYVNDQCINCAACSQFAPQSFARSDQQPFHVVYRQPQSALEIQQARQAILACPVAAIRVETQRRKNDYWKEKDQELVNQLSGKGEDVLAFPRPFLDDVPDVYWVGHHNSASFGAIPYLFRTPANVWVMVDTPKYGSSAIQAVTSLTGPKGPDYLVLTHVDDTADHMKWADHFSSHLQRVFHSGDLGQHNWLGDTTLEDVEILLENSPILDELTVFSLNGTKRHEVDWATLTEPVIIHTPGHSPGSISLFHNAGADCKILFSSDTYAFSTRTNTMTGFPRYGHDRKLQAKTLEKLLDVNFTVVAPGHGHPRDYRGMDPSRRNEELLPALRELRNG